MSAAQQVGGKSKWRNELGKVKKNQGRRQKGKKQVKKMPTGKLFSPEKEEMDGFLEEALEAPPTLELVVVSGGRGLEDGFPPR